MEAGWLKSRIERAMYGGAIGDAVGGPVEGAGRDVIEELHGTREVTDMLSYVWRDKDGNTKVYAPPGKTTDDTHFKNLLCKAILKKGGRVDSEDFANELTVDDKFAYLIMRMALLAQNRFAFFVALGSAIILGTQAAINIGVALGMLPTKGISLPFVSYGNSALISTLLMIGLVGASIHAKPDQTT